MNYHRERVRKDPECPNCGKNPSITELIDYDAFCGAVVADAAEAASDSTISATDLKEMLDRKDNIFLIDVRGRERVRDRQHPRRDAHPQGPVLTGAALERLPQDKRIVLAARAGRAAPRPWPS